MVSFFRETRKMVDPAYLFIPFFSILLFFYLTRRGATPRERKHSSPPSPWKLPVIGNLHQLGLLPHRSLASLSSRHGPLMLLHFGSVPVLVVSSAEAAGEIMRNQDPVFSNRPTLSIPHKIFYGARDIAFAAYGEYWRQIKSMSVLHLLSTRKVKSFRRVREEEASSLIERITRTGSCINLTEMIISVTNNVICRVALGRRYGEDEYGIKIKRIFPEFVDVLGAVNMADYIPWLGFINRFNGLDSKADNVAKVLDEFLSSVVAESKKKKHQSQEEEEEEASNILDILLEIQKQSKEDTPIEDETIKAIILDMFSAGTDTTASAIEWAMAELLNSPRALNTLQTEVRTLAGDNEITEDDLEKLPYLKAVIKETLRLHPSVPLLVPRESIEDTKVMGYDIPARTQVIVNAWAIGRDKNSWENPEEFRPERFVESSVDFRGLHFELIPFGAGRRGCPGIIFATAMIEILLAKLVHKFEFAVPGVGLGGLDMSEMNGIAVHKKVPLVLDVSPR